MNLPQVYLTGMDALNLQNAVLPPPPPIERKSTSVTKGSVDFSANCNHIYTVVMSGFVFWVVWGAGS